MCFFREIWIPPIILLMPMISDYVTVSIKSCPEDGDANYIIVWKFSGRRVSCLEDIDSGFLEPPPQSGKPKKKTVWIQARREGGQGCNGCAHFPHRFQRSTFLLINYLKQSELMVFSILIHWMCSKIEITVRELTIPLTLSTNIF